jgi:hypothetical protein
MAEKVMKIIDDREINPDSYAVNVDGCSPTASK